jgi:hypothetical protein
MMIISDATICIINNNRCKRHQLSQRLKLWHIYSTVFSLHLRSSQYFYSTGYRKNCVEDKHSSFFCRSSNNVKIFAAFDRKEKRKLLCGSIFLPRGRFHKTFFGVNSVTISCKMDHFINVDSVVILL